MTRANRYFRNFHRSDELSTDNFVSKVLFRPVNVQRRFPRFTFRIRSSLHDHFFTCAEGFRRVPRVVHFGHLSRTWIVVTHRCQWTALQSSPESTSRFRMRLFFHMILRARRNSYVLTSYLVSMGYRVLIRASKRPREVHGLRLMTCTAVLRGRVRQSRGSWFAFCMFMRRLAPALRFLVFVQSCRGVGPGKGSDQPTVCIKAVI